MAGTLLAYHPESVAALREPSVEDPWRVLVSGCLAAWPCGVTGTDYGLGSALDGMLSLPRLRALPFCPEQHALGTPRNMPDIHGGDGRLRKRLDPGYVPPPDARDHHEHPWTLEQLPMPHPRA